MIRVHHLNESRSQRVLWLLEELGAPYEVVRYERDPKTRLAPASLAAAHPLGKSPVVEDGRVVIAESGAAVEYLCARLGEGRLARSPAEDEWPEYVEWLHYAEGSAMPALLMRMFADRLGAGAAPLAPRIESQIANHLAYIEGRLEGRTFFVGDDLTGADVMMSFVAEVAKAFGKLSDHPLFEAWLGRMHERPAWTRALARGGPYALGA